MEHRLTEPVSPTEGWFGHRVVRLGLGGKLVQRSRGLSVKADSERHDVVRQLRIERVLGVVGRTRLGIIRHPTLDSHIAVIDGVQHIFQISVPDLGVGMVDEIACRYTEIHIAEIRNRIDIEVGVVRAALKKRHNYLRNILGRGACREFELRLRRIVHILLP